MRVTGIIPVHNHRKWVNEAFDSMLAQTHQDLKVCIVDDGSTDGSFDAVVRRLYRPKLMQESLPRVVMGSALHRRCTMMVCRFDEAHGPSFARNWGIVSSWDDSDAFALLDSDDLYHPQKIEKSVELLQDESVGAVYSDFDTLHPDGLRIRQFKPAFDRDLLLTECIVNCDSVVSKKAFQAAGLFDEQMRCCEDYDLWVRISEHLMIEHIPEALLTVRVGDHSSTATVPQKRWSQDYQRVFQKLKERTSNRQ